MRSMKTRVKLSFNLILTLAAMLTMAQTAWAGTTIETRCQEQTYISLGLRTIAQFPIHRYIGAVAGLSESMDGACAFFMPILIVLALQAVR